jgi:NADPH-dependent 2,4-dienoyl-CoA reductase/sulfur reductase-like enzyme
MYDPLPWIDRTADFSLGGLFDHPGWRLWGKTSRPDKRVCVIGGGISGLAAAYELIDGGAKVKLLEASDGLHAWRERPPLRQPRTC